MADAAKMATSTLTRWAARPLQETTVDSMLDEPHVTRDRVSTRNEAADLPLPEWLAHRAMLANVALAQTPISHLGPAARILLAGQAQSPVAAAASHQPVRAFLAERSREAILIPNLDLIASTPAGCAYGPDGSVTEFQRRELTVSAVQALLTENDVLRAQLATTTPPPSITPDASSEVQDFSPGEMVLYGLADQPLNQYSASEIAMMDEQAALADAESEAQRTRTRRPQPPARSRITRAY